MLTDADRELIAAAVDGDLTPADEATFRRLLADSSAACDLFRRLQTDARQLRGLPRVAAPAGLADHVLGRLQPKATPRPEPIAAPTRRGSLLPFAIAASALLAVTAGSFWLANHRDDDADAVAQQNTLPPDDPTPDSPALPRESVAEAAPAPRPSVPTLELPRTPRDFAAVPPEVAPLPRTPTPTVVGGPGLGHEPRPFDVVEVRLPFLAPVAELDRPETKARVLEELAQEPAYRLDLFGKDLIPAAEAFQAAARAAGLKVNVEPVAQERIRKKVPPAAWAVYTEALTAEEIAQLMARLAPAARSADQPLTTAHLIPAQDPERRALADVLGKEPAPWKRPAGTDPKSIAAGTGDQLAAALKEKGGKPAEKPAILVSYLPVSARVKNSPDVKAFADKLGTRKPGAVPLLVVIRQAN